MIILVFLFFIIYSILAWRGLDWATVLIILALPSYLIRFEILGIPFTILEAMILIAFFVWFIKETNFLNFLRGRYKIKNYLENRKTRDRYPFGWELSLLVLVAWIAAVAAGFSHEALGIWKAYFFEPALFFILVLNVFRGGKVLCGETMPEPTNRGLVFSAKEDLVLLPPTSPQPSPCEGEGEENIRDLTPTLSLRRRGGNNFEKIMWALAGSAFLVSVFAIYQKITGNFIANPLWQAEATRRAVSFFGYPNAVGLFLGPIVLILAGWLFSNAVNKEEAGNGISNFQFLIFKQFSIFQFKNFQTIFTSLTIVLSLLAIYFAKSEGALFGIIMALFIFGILAGGKLRSVTIISAMVIFVSVLSYPPARIRAVEKITLRDLSGEIRKQQWRETWLMMTESPTRFIFGTGFSGYQKAIAPYHQDGIFFNSDREPWEQFHRKTVFNEEYRRTHWQPVEIYMYPHNIFLNFWTELGLMGVLLFVWIIGKYFRILISNFEFPPIRGQGISKQNLISNVLKLNNSKLIQNSKFLVLRSDSAGGKIQNSAHNTYIYLNMGLIGAMTVIFVHGFVDVPYFKNDLAVMFWLLIAMMGLLNFEIKNK